MAPAEEVEILLSVDDRTLEVLARSLHQPMNDGEPELYWLMEELETQSAEFNLTTFNSKMYGALFQIAEAEHAH